MDIVDKVFSYLPLRVREKILRIAVSRGVGSHGISEIRVRAVGNNSIVISGERVLLSSLASREEIAKTVSLMCEGSLYAYREGIKDGYISLRGGVRVGICGQARYDGGELVGISDISSLVIRIPTGAFTGGAQLYEAFARCLRGMLIYSPPGVGKTTALRQLASLIGGGRAGQQVAVIDERCEFIVEDYKNASVDILRGYKRSDGVEIALRTLCPGVIVVDEIGRAREAESMLDSLNSGVRILASAHASSLAELRKRTAMKPFFENDIFDVFAGIVSEAGRRRLIIERI